MGFRMQVAKVQAGSSAFPVGDTDALRLSRSQTLLTMCAQALIDCNVGWQLDTTKSATTTSYTDIPDKSGTKNYPGLFFVNTISGCKLFLAYFGDNVYYYGIKDFGGDDVTPINGYKNHGGLCASMIPGESSQTFGDPTTTTFIPSHATRIYGTYNRDTANPTGSDKYAAAYNPTNGWVFWYCMMATESVVCIYTSHWESGQGGWMACPVYACGKIFGVISHPQTEPNAKYGVISFRNPPYNNYESWAGIPTRSFSPFDYSFSVPWSNTNSNGYTGGSFSRADGSWVNGSQVINGNWCNASYFTSDISLCDTSKTFTLSGSYRWASVGMTVNTYGSQIATLGVTPGNGFKGYLDTALFRVTNTSAPQTLLDNGNFCCPEGNGSGWILGWDPSNPSIDG